MGKGLQRWLRPLPMGLLAALLSALVLLPTLLGVSEGRLLQYPQTLQHRDGRTHLLGAGDRFGLRLLGWLVALLLRRDQSLARALEQALRRDEFELDYQPLVDLASGCARTCSSRRPRAAGRSPRSPAG
nr:hypothetical protein [Pseudomonas sp. UBA6718]